MAWSAERKAALILAAIAITEGWWLAAMLYFNGLRFFRYTGFIDGRATVLSWFLALLLAITFILASARLPSVRANLFTFSPLKLLAVALAIAAGFCEETVFRKMLMDWGLRHGEGAFIQIALSALTFGAAHGIWGLFRGSFRTAAGATAATGILGAALAALYLVAQRSVAPCIISHLLINLFIEPGLVLAAVRGEMARSGGSS